MRDLLTDLRAAADWVATQLLTTTDLPQLRAGHEALRAVNAAIRELEELDAPRRDDLPLIRRPIVNVSPPEDEVKETR